MSGDFYKTVNPILDSFKNPEIETLANEINIRFEVIQGYFRNALGNIITEDDDGAYVSGKVVATSGSIGGFNLGTYDIWGGHSNINDPTTTIVLGNLDGTAKLALGASADALTVAGGAAGFVVDGDGKFYAGDGSTEFIKYDGTNPTISTSSSVDILGGGDLAMIGNDANPSLIRLIDPPSDTDNSSEVRFEREAKPTEYWYMKKVPEEHATQSDFFIIAPTDELIAAVTTDAKIIMGKHPFESNSAYSFSVLVSDLFEVQIDGGGAFYCAGTNSTFNSNVIVANGLSISLQEDITFTGATTENQIKFPDKLANALSFQEAGNIYQTFITTDGSEAVYFGKNVGIGTTTPGAPLHIFSGAGADSYFSGATGNALCYGYDTDIDNYGGWINYRGYQDGVSRFRDLLIGDGKGNAITFFDGSSGNVGIGVTDPDAAVEIFNTATQLKLSYDATNYATFAVAADGALIITTVDVDAAEADIEFAPDGRTNFEAGDVNIASGDLLFEDAGAGLSFGTLSLHEGAENVDISGAGSGVYVKITGFNAGEMNNVSENSDAFNVGAVGVYKIDWQVSGDSAGSNLTYEIDIFINGFEQPDGSCRRKFGAATDYGSMSGTAILDITDTGHDIDIRMKEVGGAGTDFDIFHMNFNIVMVGGTQ